MVYLTKVIYLLIARIGRGDRGWNYDADKKIIYEEL